VNLADTDQCARIVGALADAARDLEHGTWPGELPALTDAIRILLTRWPEIHPDVIPAQFQPHTTPHTGGTNP
jgi:hypothetical protein